MAYSVTFITSYIGSLLEGDIHLKNVEIEGEISNITYHKSGNIYFTLKDKASVISCTMYRSDAIKLTAKYYTGDNIVAKGRISVYKARGNYQLIASKIKSNGEGELYRKFIELKESLAETGMFDESYKRPIPRFVRTLGIVTSPTGAAIRDIINIATRRNPYISVILYPALVQGDYAALSVAEGISAMNEINPDVIIVGRGGGSMEDLWAFNEEIVAKAIFASSTPVISAVGHETDFTIADFVADLRAPTPSAGAELAVFDYYEYKNGLLGYRDRIDLSMMQVLKNKKQRLMAVERHLISMSPQRKIESKRQRLSEIEKRLDLAIKNTLNMTREHMKRDARSLWALSPAVRLGQGYSYVTDEKGRNIYKIDKVKPNDKITVRVTDGEIRARVTEVI